MLTRLALSVPVMAAIALATGGRVDWSVVRATAQPAVFFFGSMALSFESIRHTSIANQTLIGSLSTVVVMVAAPRLLGETVAPLQVVLAAVGFGGTAAVVFGAGDVGRASLLGDAFALGGMALWGAYVIAAKRARTAGRNGWAFLAGNFGWSVVYGVPWAVLGGFSLGQLGTVDWVLVLTMVVAQGVAAHGLHAWALRHLDATVSSLLTLGCPVLSAIGAYAIYGERLSTVQLVGATVVLGSLAGVAVVARGARPAPIVSPASP
jgi:drug/metabolite transporter (DMT)-like permease